MGPVRLPQAGAVFAAGYRVLRPLGQGGMGAVYLVEHIATGAQRALKILHPAHCADERLVRLFQQEARIGHRIPSDHVIDVIDAGVEEGTPWLVMELLEGESLAKHVERVGPLPAGHAAEILGQIGHALGAAHAVGVVHRDLKPENVFIATARRQGDALLVKLLDFGVAKVIHEARLTGTMIGTPRWMAPEQLTGAPVLPSTDVWAFGLLAFWMLTGTSYWSVEDRALLKHLFEISGMESVPPASVRAAEIGCAELLPTGFDAWFARCVVPARSARFSEAGVASDALRSLLCAPQVPRTAQRHPVIIDPSAGATAKTETPDADGVQPVEVFISYAPGDEALRARLEVHMSLLQRQGWIRAWHRGKVTEGQALDTVIAERLEAARLLLLLVSARFLGCDDCYEKEMKRALERDACGDARVLPIIAEACDWEEGPFGHIAVLPKGGRPVRSWRIQSEAWANVVRGIRAAAAELALPPALARKLRAEEDMNATDELMLRGETRGTFGLRVERMKGYGLYNNERAMHHEIVPRFVRAAFRSEHDAPARPLRFDTPPAQQIGRERDVLACLGKIGPAGCVIWGESGVGKTTFARHLVKELAPHYDDMQIEIDLAGTSLNPKPAEVVMAEVIFALGSEGAAYWLPGGEQDLASLYTSTLEGRRVLLLLDDACDSAQVEPLLPPSGSLLIVTSRDRLTLPGIQAFPLDPLTSEEAVAMMRGISARLDETAAHTTARLCEFFPLAVCIAARGLTMDSADTSKFIEEIQALREGADAVEAMHRWALDRINAPLRALWTMMSVFPADFGLRAAAAVGAMALSEIGEALHALLDRGLLTRDQSAPRFRMHDRSRRIARSHVDPALLGVAARRHAEHFWSRLYVMQPGDELEAFCELEEASLDAAQAWAEASMEADEAAAIICCDLPVTASFCWRGLRRRDRERWLLSGLFAARCLGRDERAYMSAIRSVEQHGDARGAPREFHEQTLASVRKLGNQAVEYAVLGRLAGRCANENDWPRAMELRNEQITVARRLGDPECQASALEQLGVACLQVGEPGRAIESYEECLVTVRERGDRDGEFVMLDVYARFYARQQDWRRAIALRMDQFDIGRSFADLDDGRRWFHHTLYQLDALVRLDAGRRGDALEAGERCLPAVIHSLGNRAAEAVHLDTIARWCEREGDWCHAIALREALLVIAREKGDREWELELQKQISRTGERHRSMKGSP